MRQPAVQSRVVSALRPCTLRDTGHLETLLREQQALWSTWGTDLEGR